MPATDSARLAWRFALAGGSRHKWRIVVASIVAFAGLTLILLSVAVFSGFQHTDSAVRTRAWQFADSKAGASALVQSDYIQLGEAWVEVVYVAPLPGAPQLSLPGLEKLPPVGTYAVTPALAADVRRDPALGSRLEVASVLSAAGVASGEERYAIGTVPLTRLQESRYAVPVVGTGGTRPATPRSIEVVPLWMPAVAVGLLLTLPGTLLLATSAGLAAATREHRMALMRRMGAGSAGSRIAIFEALILTAPGFVLAVATWWAFIGRTEVVPIVGARLLSDAWEFTPRFAVAVVYSLLVVALATTGLSRRRSRLRVDPIESPKGRSAVLVAGVFLVLLSPWLSRSAASNVFLLGVLVAALGAVFPSPVGRGFGELFSEEQALLFRSS